MVFNVIYFYWNVILRLNIRNWNDAKAVALFIECKDTQNFRFGIQIKKFFFIN